MKPADLRAFLQTCSEWPPVWGELVEGILKSDEPALWPDGIPPVQLCTLAYKALKLTREETNRPTADDEDERLYAVARALAELREAIERAPLPRNRAALWRLSAVGMPDAKQLVGWRDVPDDAHAGTYNTSLLNMVAMAESMLQEHWETLPPRVVKRQRKRPAAVAFVRWLHAGAAHYGMSLPAETLAVWAEVAVGEAMTPRDVRKIIQHPQT